MSQYIQKSLELYKQQLQQEDIQFAYHTLMKYLSELKILFSKHYQTGNISPGYLDYSYFPFYNAYLREHKLRFGIVLNHKDMQFELWLMGQNADIQKYYWNKLKDSKWNEGKECMPKYSILEVVLEHNINFKNKETMTNTILKHAISLSTEIQQYINQIS